MRDRAICPACDAQVTITGAARLTVHYTPGGKRCPRSGASVDGWTDARGATWYWAPTLATWVTIPED